MARVVLVRAVNVGGAQLPMAELRELATQLGATDVSTYIASGNLLCNPPGESADFDRALEAAVEARFGFFREVISRTASELQAALDAFPFDRRELKYCHLYFLAGEPTPVAAEALAGRGLEQLEVIGRDLHIRYSAGVASTKLTTPLIHRTLGVVGTGRNLDTVAKLIELAS
ncbi:MAG TPA: DUF1697 domain-containing protein [Ilumatobacter sp.]|nr:DUF1697 domain-containing protein [Ilumatobacter sp.]